MKISPLAGKPAPQTLLVDIPRLIAAYYTEHPDPAVRSQQVSFGTSGHRGSSLDCSFNEDHILAISQAIVEHRTRQGYYRAVVCGEGHTRAFRTGFANGC